MTTGEEIQKQLLMPTANLSLTHFMPSDPLKTPENLLFSDACRIYRKKPVALTSG